MTRHHVIFFFALIALSGSLVAVWATGQERDYQLRGYVDATQNPALPFRVPRLGINAELTQYTPAELARQLNDMRAAHITWVRQMFRWDEIEPQSGSYEWEKWDQIVDAIQQHPDLQLVAVLVNSPAWAQAPNTETSPTAPPKNLSDFTQFAEAFAHRYGDRVTYYQIWDEPNLTAAWGRQEPRASEYAALLNAAYDAIHAADSNASVIAAALAPTTETGPDNISDILYLRDLYSLGLASYTDGIAAKPFGFNSAPDDRTIEPNVLNFSRIIALREEMVRNGDNAKPLWASSFAWNSLPENWLGAPSIWGNVFPEEQVRYTLDALNRADREWPWLAGMILYHWQPLAALDDPTWGFALIGQQNEHSPLWAALSEREPQLAADNGLYQAANPYARFGGVWRFSELGADIGWLDDSQVSFEFVGQDVALLLRQGDYVAYLYPTIDGQQANVTPRDASGNAYVLLTSNSREPTVELAPVARHLYNVQHTLHVTADRGQGRWSLVGFAVSTGDLYTPYNRQIGAAFFTVVVAVTGVIVSGWSLQWQPLLAHWYRLLGRLNDAGQLAISGVTSVALLVGMLVTWGDNTPALLRRESVQLGLALLTGGLIYLQPGVVLTLVGAFGLFVIFYNRPELGLTLTIFWAPFFLFPVELHLFAFPIAEILILLTFAAWLLRLVARWGRNRQGRVSQLPAPIIAAQLHHLKALDYGVILWLVIGILSLSWAAQRAQAMTELRVMIVEPVLFYVIFRTSIMSRKDMLLIVDALLLAGIMVAVIGLWLFFQDQAVITAEAGTKRLASVYGSPNNVGLLLGRCIPFALAYLLSPTDRARRLTAGLGLAVMLLSVLLSQSVGAIFLGVPAAVTVVFLLLWRRRAALALAGLLGIIAAISPFLFQSARFARAFDFSSGTNFFRIRVWQSTVNMIRDHPLTGLGLDQFLYAFRGQYIMPDAWQEPNLSHPHNFVLDVWVRLGILGIINFFWIQAGFWQAIFQAYRYLRARDSLLLALSIGAIGSMANLLSHGLVDNSVYVQDLCYIYVLLLGLAVNLSNIRTIDQSGQMVV